MGPETAGKKTVYDPELKEAVPADVRRTTTLAKKDQVAQLWLPGRPIGESGQEHEATTEARLNNGTHAGSQQAARTRQEKQAGEGARDRRVSDIAVASSGAFGYRGLSHLSPRRVRSSMSFIIAWVN